METLFIVAVLLLALSSSSFTRGQRIIQIPPPRPLCVSQYALANYACARVPVTTVLPSSPTVPPSPDHDHDDDHDHDHDHHPHDDDHHDHHDHDHDDDDDDHDHDHDDDDDHDHDDDDHDHDDDDDHDHDDDDHHHHHDDDDHGHDDDDHDHDHDDHDHDDHDHHDNDDDDHHHHHHHLRVGDETYGQQDCCKWLRQIDNECVCDLLVTLPPLLSKPAHNYTVFVDDSCIVTFTCGGRLLH